MCVVRNMFWLPCAACILAGSAGRAAEALPAAAPIGSLHLTSGDVMAGTLSACDRPDVLRWQSPAFATPFDFDLNAVRSVEFPVIANDSKPTGDYCLELSAGDLLYGMLVGMSAEELQLDTLQFGRIHVRRGHVRRIIRRNDRSDLVYAGPKGLSGWVEHSVFSGWHEDAGQLFTADYGASNYGDFGIPKQARIELEISWEKNPDFVMALAANRNPKQFDSAFRIEVWDDDLVAVRETDHDADVASLAKIAPGAGRVQLQAFLDQQRDRLIVFSANGKQLADLTVSDGQPNPLPGIRLINKHGDFRLERLRIAKWNGEPPRELPPGSARIHGSDGSMTYGEIKGFDPAAGQFTVRQGTKDVRIDANVVGNIVMPSPDESQARSIAVVLQDGTRLSGPGIKVDADRLWLACPAVTEPLSIPLAGLRALFVLKHQPPTDTDRKDLPRLELEGTRINGTLVDGRADGPANSLAWQPRASETASTFRQDASARIVYREQPPKTAPRPARPATGRQIVRAADGRVFEIDNGVLRVLVDPRAQSQVRRPQFNVLHPSLYLRTGDAIPCEVTRIDEAGVTIKTPVSDAVFVPHDKVKAVELASESITVQLDDEKRERLLTLPRMQKNNPPAHLIRAKNGDYLRARLIAMDGESLTVEVRLETKKIPRNQVSRIIWLHADELNEGEHADAAPGPPMGKLRVQAVRTDGNRLTFFPEQLTGTTLSGTSEVLGACRVELTDVDQLLVGGAIEDAAAELAYQKWQLQHAVEPKFTTADGSDAGDSLGTESPLVGKPAPDFELTLLGGERFRLNEHNGHVVVLEFWATWCAPCIQTMHEAEEVIEDFRDRNVLLVAVNLLEDPDRIAATLERLHLQVSVALDQYGVVAEKYAATAIPQIVVIDGEGNVARLFVGRGPRLAERLREALEALSNGASDASSP